MTEKSSVVTIPATLDGAKKVLGGIGGLVNAREWERAAIVATFVRLPGDHEAATGKYLSARKFAELEIYGLRSVTTVTMMVNRWRSLGQGFPKPGQQVPIPNKPWADSEGVIALAEERRKFREADAAQLIEKVRETMAAKKSPKVDTSVHIVQPHVQITSPESGQAASTGSLSLVANLKVTIDSMVRLGMHAELREALAYIDSHLSIDA